MTTSKTPNRLTVEDLDLSRIRIDAYGNFCVRDILLCYISSDAYRTIFGYCWRHRLNLLVFERTHFPAQGGMPSSMARSIAPAQLPFLFDAFRQAELHRQAVLGERQHKDDIRAAKTKQTNQILLQKRVERTVRAESRELDLYQLEIDRAALELEREQERERERQSKDLAAFERELIKKARQRKKSLTGSKSRKN
jgi:hypothetical protein